MSLGLAFDTPHSYSFEFDSERRGRRSKYVATAQGDLDGDGQLSEFSIRGEAADPDASVNTDAEIRAFIRRAGDTIFHPAGTCRMGRSSAAVVDPQLRLRGIEGLRIADASIMPTMVSGNTQAAVFMIAEKAADMILREASQGRALVGATVSWA